MKRLLLSLLVWATSLTAYAQDEELSFDAPCAPEVTELRRAILQHEDQPGIWFHMEVARCMLGRLAVLPELALQVQLFEQRRQASEVLEASLERRGDLAVQEADAAREGLSASRRVIGRLEERTGAWDAGMPALWFALGIVAALAIGVGGAYVLDVVTP